MNFPKEVFIDFTDICNYKCVFCTNRLLKERHILRLNDIKGFDELINGAERIDITGWGEVTTHPDFKEIIGFLTKLKKPFVLTTNGFLLNKEIIDLLRISSMELINISLNSLNEETYKILSGGCGDLKKVLNNIDLLAQKPRNYELFASFVMTNHNLNELKDIARFSKDNDIKITLFDLTPTIKDYPKGLMIEDNPLNREKILEAQEHAKKIGVDLPGIKFDNRKPEKKKEIITGCEWPSTKIFIRWDGVITPCCWCLEEMGNVMKQNWKKIWNNEKYSDLRECVKKGDLKYCKDCRRLG